MKVTREEHGLWKEWDSKSLEKKYLMPPIVGKWHYHYENQNGTIGLIKLNTGIRFEGEKMTWRGHVYEACGVLDFKQFKTKEDAEIAIYSALGEEYPGPIGQKTF